MRLLLDTHALLWFLLDDVQLSATAKALIADSANEVEVSPASYWEIAIKISIGKYYLPEPLEVFLERELAANAFRILAIEPRHVAPLTSLSFHHRDDRLLIAQAMVESIPVISNDPVLDAYPVARLWEESAIKQVAGIAFDYENLIEHLRIQGHEASITFFVAIPPTPLRAVSPDCA